MTLPRALVQAKIAALLAASLTVTGCLAPSTLAPVANDNAHNISVLTENVKLTYGLLVQLQKSAANARLALHLAIREDQLIGMTTYAGGAAPAEGLQWTDYWKSAQKQELIARYGDLQARLKQNPALVESPEIQAEYGLLVAAASNVLFTPARAHKLLKELDTLRQFASKLSQNEYLATRVKMLLPWDLGTRMIDEENEAILDVLTTLGREIASQLSIAGAHSRAFQAFSESKVDPAAVVANFLSDAEVNKLAENLIDKGVTNPATRKRVKAAWNAIAGEAAATAEQLGRSN